MSLNTKRESFTNKSGFILSCVGAALGLGNIWMFSYKLGQYGGAAFLIPYFLFVFILGTSGLITEFSFGRLFNSGSMGGVKSILKDRNIKGASFISAIPAIGLIGVFMFYSVVIGWILKYFSLSITGGLSNIDVATYFDSFSGTASSIPWFILAVILTLIIVCFGVSKGIEKANKIMMPLLLIIFVLLAIRTLSLDGAMEGVKYLLIPRWEHLFRAETWVMALGQAFFTVSLNGCGMVVYGSYINDKFDIPSSAFSTAIFDTLAALLAAFMIMPAVFAFGLDPAAGPALLFITIPSIFKAMPLGNLISSLFFLSIIFAAVSSSINMLEGVCEPLITFKNWSRKKAAGLICAITIVAALPLTLDGNLFGNFADFVTIIISPICVLIVAICYFFLFKGNMLDEINKGAKHPIGKWFINFGKYVFIPVTLLIIILGVSYGGIG